MGRLFGTDGVRGLANADLTPTLALRLATSAARILAPASDSRRPVAVVGRDPRVSGEMLEAAVAAGLASAGMDVLLLGVVPTPAVAHLTGALDAALGVVISASHNAMPDNGIKFFAAGGHKLPDDVEDAIEQGLGSCDDGLPVGARIGRIRRAHQEIERYEQHLLDALPHPLNGLKIVVDCAHGAASRVAPEVYRRAGAQVITLAGDPDGLNINDGVGSTHLDVLKTVVVAEQADLGIAHDGDADRCLAVDGQGNVIDGDRIMAILALSMSARGKLHGNTLVATVMSNLGLKLAMADNGIDVVETGVGDRYVLERLNADGYSLGGEQSGHVIMSEFATTGDGILTGLHIAAEIVRSGKPLVELAQCMTVYPQVLVNVRGVDRSKAASDEVLQQAVAQAELVLGGQGRVLLRPSGTEPVVRVMVEAADEAQAKQLADDLAAIVKDRLAV